jgi:hypothetical protein
MPCYFDWIGHLFNDYLRLIHYRPSLYDPWHIFVLRITIPFYQTID